MSQDLIAFIRTRLDEDEQVAVAVGQRRLDWYLGSGVIHAEHTGEGLAVGGYECDLDDEVGEHIARHDPARVLREVEAKRQILTVHEHVRPWSDDRVGCYQCATNDWGDTALNYDDEPEAWCDTVRWLAACWADHPDYLPEWRPA